MFLFTKRPDRLAQVRLMPGCLVKSLLLSVVLTVLINSNARRTCSPLEGPEIALSKTPHLFGVARTLKRHRARSHQ